MTIEDHIEREVQRRLTDRLASAGVSQSRIALEVLFLLPPDFVRAYENLFNRALKEPGLEGVGNRDAGSQVKRVSRKSRLSARGKTRIAEGAGAKAQSKRHRDYWIVRDERALKHKSLIDRRLRRMAREMFEQVEGVDQRLKPRPCDRCGTDLIPYGELGMVAYCPACGHAVGRKPG